ncbi:GNAT family N-acetyltransferase [Pseudobacillus badius]|uniref:GNAT family N-acetyltransferase n=1 Tax=Bacillus badius TaxID=1455 RepID=UPI000597512D|nr:GNAT family N-acetyltransferase [Bacillus badius]KIL74436.1 Protein export cytoplasm protein SecA ATPase RNA helicase [Bacillus badius]KZR58899.1 GNAT family acetyltransferase [Bacillus badius]
MDIEKQFFANGTCYTIRIARHNDAQALSDIRLQIDGETENLDREKGEGFIDKAGFERFIQSDIENEKNLFLVAVVSGKIVGFSRCEGNHLKRFAHKVEFGVGILQDYWGRGIGKNLLKESIAWADANNIEKMTLHVLETNEKAIRLYEKCGFQIEGLLQKDKILSDGNYYNTVVMGRFNG